MITILLKNAKVLNSNFEYEYLDVVVKNGKITAIHQPGACKDDTEVLDLSGYKLIPGLVNIHIHGSDGYDTMDGYRAGLEKMSRFLAEGGVTAFLPTTTTMPFDVTEKAMQNVAATIKEGTDGATVLGINQEGPFISEEYKGAHDPAQIRPATLSEFEQLQKAADGNIKIVTIAPETQGAMEFIEKISGQVVVSLGHTAADFDTCTEAIDRGAKLVTHLFSAMPSLHHRELSLVAAASEKEIFVEMICDGVHIDSAMVRVAYRLFGRNKIVVITDSMCATGLTDGEYNLGGRKVFVKDGQARNAEGRLAGGTSTMIECVRNLVSWGIREEDAIFMATHNPCKVLGIDDRKGAIAVGMDADLVAVNDDLNIRQVLVGGKIFG